MFLLPHDKFEGLKSDHTHGFFDKKKGGRWRLEKKNVIIKNESEEPIYQRSDDFTAFAFSLMQRKHLL